MNLVKRSPVVEKLLKVICLICRGVISILLVQQVQAHAAEISLRDLLENCTKVRLESGETGIAIEYRGLVSKFGPKNAALLGKTLSAVSYALRPHFTFTEKLTVHLKEGANAEASASKDEMVLPFLSPEKLGGRNYTKRLAFLLMVALHELGHVVSADLDVRLSGLMNKYDFDRRLPLLSALQIARLERKIDELEIKSNEIAAENVRKKAEFIDIRAKELGLELPDPEDPSNLYNFAYWNEDVLPIDRKSAEFENRLNDNFLEIRDTIQVLKIEEKKWLKGKFARKNLRRIYLEFFCDAIPVLATGNPKAIFYSLKGDAGAESRGWVSARSFTAIPHDFDDVPTLMGHVALDDARVWFGENVVSKSLSVEKRAIALKKLGDAILRDFELWLTTRSILDLDRKTMNAKLIETMSEVFTGFAQKSTP